MKNHARKMKSHRRKRRLRRKFAIEICLIIATVSIVIWMAKGNKDDQDIKRYTVQYCKKDIFETEELPSVMVEKEAVLIDIEGISQDGYPTGCEIVSTAALLNFYNILVDVDDMIALLPKQDFYYKDGLLYGANPEEKFPGNPYEKNGLGCYPPVIKNVITKLSQSELYRNHEISAIDLSGNTLDDICERYIKNDKPVLVWVTTKMQLPEDGMTYYLENGKRYRWKAGEHCMVLCGYDSNNYYFKDPLQDGRTVSYPKDITVDCYNAMGMRALAIAMGDGPFCTGSVTSAS